MVDRHVAVEKERSVALVVRIKRLEVQITRFFDISDILMTLFSLAMTPRSRDLAIFVLTATTTDGQTNPFAHACGVIT